MYSQVSTESKARLATDDEINEARWYRLRKLGKKARRKEQQLVRQRCSSRLSNNWAEGRTPKSKNHFASSVTAAGFENLGRRQNE